MSDILDSRDLEDEITESDDIDPRRLAALLELRSELEGYGWEYGIALIPESEWVDYAQQLAEDIGAIDPDAGWPARCIDWERAADELRVDYSSVEFEGVTYYWREA